MSSSAAERVGTFEELYRAIEALPEGLTGEILEPGTIRTMGRPGGPHRYTASRIPRSLGSDEVTDAGRWWLEQEAEVRFGERLAVPDMSGWRLGEDETVPPTFVYDNPIDRCPDWCCEVLSPSTESIDRDKKVPLYTAEGVAWIWLVDPHERTIEVLRVRDGVATLLETVDADAVRTIPPFDSTIDVGRWWMPTPTAKTP